jgi:threonyl-tRNA synthetase
MVRIGMEPTANLEQLRHSAAHLLAHAVYELYPDTLFTIGPATEDGFFYDMLPHTNFKECDLPLIEERMRELAKRNYPIVHTLITAEKAREIFKDNRFKLQLIDEINQPLVGLATQGEFKDLCRGGHVSHTGDIQHFKLEAISGSYWKANRDDQALQRISGTAFFSDEELKKYEQKKLDAIQYDHRRLGKQLDLFSFHEEGPGFAFFHPKGRLVLNLLIEYMRKLQKEYNYQEISTPILLSDSLWHQSGHYAHYKDKMYFCSIDEREFAVKPMNCPGSTLIFSERPRSYRELPLKLAEFGLVHRHELSGVLHGLMRVRSFTQDDAHIYCTIDQVEDQVVSIIRMMQRLLAKFSFTNVSFAVSTRPDDSMGDDIQWEKATNALTNALQKEGISHKIQDKEGAFYGPKIEVKIQDAMEREWQCGTVQIDFNMPHNFDLSFINSKGEKERPVMVHQAIYGSFERIFAIILEHYKGLLPFWLCPVQVRALPITNAQQEYAHEIINSLKAAGIRADMDASGDPLSGQIKNAQAEKIPWMLVLGKKETELNVVTLRHRDGKQELNLPLNQIIEKAHELMNI